MTTKTEALKLALEALEKIAFTGMAAPPEMSEDGRTKWHAKTAFHFIGIAAWALDSVKEALAQSTTEPKLCATRPCRSCGGTGLRDTGIDEAPATICKPCGGTGQIDIAAQPDRIPDAGKTISEEPSLPEQATGWDNGLSQDYNKKLGAWFSEKPNAKQELRARTFDDYGNKIV
jgi:hypothetical protein